MISWAHRPSRAAAISAINGLTFSASLRTGTTMETATAAVSEDGTSTLIVLNWPAAGPIASAFTASASYGADASRATPLRAPSEGPVNDVIAPSWAMANPRRRAANQYRTPIAPTTPTSAPATTSLG